VNPDRKPPAGFPTGGQSKPPEITRRRRRLVSIPPCLLQEFLKLFVTGGPLETSLREHPDRAVDEKSLILPAVVVPQEFQILQCGRGCRRLKFDEVG